MFCISDIDLLWHRTIACWQPTVNRLLMEGPNTLLIDIVMMWRSNGVQWFWSVQSNNFDYRMSVDLFIGTWSLNELELHKRLLMYDRVPVKQFQHWPRGDKVGECGHPFQSNNTFLRVENSHYKTRRCPYSFNLDQRGAFYWKLASIYLWRNMTRTLVINIKSCIVYWEWMNVHWKLTSLSIHFD